LKTEISRLFTGRIMQIIDIAFIEMSIDIFYE